MARASRQVWTKRVERWRDSGLGVKEYAAQAGLSADRLRHWGWRLSKPSASAPDHSPPPSPLATPLSFVEVSAGPARLSPGKDDEHLHIVVPSSVRIVVPPRFDEACLRRVLAVVR
jgi:hypothetical protein